MTDYRTHGAILTGLADELGFECDGPTYELGLNPMVRWSGNVDIVVLINEEMICFYSIWRGIPGKFLYQHELCDPNLIEILREKVEKWV